MCRPSYTIIVLAYLSDVGLNIVKRLNYLVIEYFGLRQPVLYG